MYLLHTSRSDDVTRYLADDKYFYIDYSPVEADYRRCVFRTKTDVSKLFTFTIEMFSKFSFIIDKNILRLSYDGKFVGTMIHQPISMIPTVLDMCHLAATGTSQKMDLQFQTLVGKFKIGDNVCNLYDSHLQLPQGSVEITELFLNTVLDDRLDFKKFNIVNTRTGKYLAYDHVYTEIISKGARKAMPQCEFKTHTMAEAIAAPASSAASDTGEFESMVRSAINHDWTAVMTSGSGTNEGIKIIEDVEELVCVLPMDVNAKGLFKKTCEIQGIITDPVKPDELCFRIDNLIKNFTNGAKTAEIPGFEPAVYYEYTPETLPPDCN